MIKTSNKRRNKRINCLVPVEGKRGSIFDYTKTVDISKGGLGVVSGSEIPLNKRIAIEIDLAENTEPVFVVGRVKWVTPIINSPLFRVGILFEKILNGSKSQLYRYFQA